MRAVKHEGLCVGCNKYPKQVYALAPQFTLCHPCLKIVVLFAISAMLED